MKRVMRDRLVHCLALLAAFLLVWSCTPRQEAAPGKEAAIPSDWQKQWEQVLAAGKQEGVVVIYGQTAPSTRESITKKFEETHGIKLDFVLGRVVELAARWDKESKAGINAADIFSVGGGTLALIPIGAHGPLEPRFILPEVRDPRAWPEGKFPFIDSGKTYMALSRQYLSYAAVNTEMVKEGQLKSYRDILKPEWAGKVALSDPTIPGAGAGYFAHILKLYGAEEGKKYMEQFAATKPALTRDLRQLAEWLAKGKYAIAVGAQPDLIAEFKVMGAPVALPKFVTEGGNINPGTNFLAVSVKPAHPNAATVFINWILSREGQIAYNTPVRNPPARVDVSVEGVDPMFQALPGDKAYLVDEKFFQLQGQAQQIAKELFTGQ